LGWSEAKPMENGHDDELLLAYLEDKRAASAGKNIAVFSYFLDERQQALAAARFKRPGDAIEFWGGYPAAERRLAVFLPDYLTLPEAVEKSLPPLAFIRAEFDKDDGLSHRDFLGSLVGAGIRRESIGDILVSNASCDVVLERPVLPYLLSNLDRVGRSRPKVAEITADELRVREAKLKTINDTVASLRLDSVAASGFSMGRGAAASLIKGGKVSLNYLECQKPDRAVAEGDVITIRGKGKIRLAKVAGKTKKDRFAIVIEKYV